MTPSTNSSNWITKVQRAVQAEPRKAAILGVLLVVMGLAWAKVAGQGGVSPAAASANQPAGTEAAVRPGSPVAPASASPLLAAWCRTKVSPVTRNLFAVKLDFFPQDGTGAGGGPRDPQGDGFWEQLAKSMTARVDQQKARQILVENLRLQASQLDLQTTLVSDTPRALINGEMVAEGGVVSGFRVTRIGAREVVVEREGLRFVVPFR